MCERLRKEEWRERLQEQAWKCAEAKYDTAFLQGADFVATERGVLWELFDELLDERASLLKAQRVLMGVLERMNNSASREIAQLLELVELAYDQGFIDGLTAYAINRGGEQVVGHGHRTLKDAVERRHEGWSYTGPRSEEVDHG